MQLTWVEYLSYTAIIMIALACLIIQAFMWYTLRSKENYEKTKELNIWKRNVALLIITAILSLCVAYPWYMYETIKQLQLYLASKNPDWSIMVQIICMLVVGQMGILINFSLLIKFVVLKRYANFSIEQLYKEEEQREEEFNNLKRK
ncbi:hypothetical protein [Mycoplasmopsis felifaucium]|uniref:hypothetical protein n=1 Tax=Mycoplasmopsis felifaucium TaxID=35768 RepID=UPI0012ECA0C6|nr:hypothetical protein [Mycoplasmopsis felifaucium]